MKTPSLQEFIKAGRVYIDPSLPAPDRYCCLDAQPVVYLVTVSKIRGLLSTKKTTYFSARLEARHKASLKKYMHCTFYITNIHR